MAYTVDQRLCKEEGEHAGAVPGCGCRVLLADMGQEAGAARFGSVAEEMTGGGAPVDRDSRRSSGLRLGRGVGAGYGLADLTQDLRPNATLLLPVHKGPYLGFRVVRTNTVSPTLIAIGWISHGQ